MKAPTPAEILAERKRDGLTQRQAAKLVGYRTYRTWQECEAGRRNMPAIVQWEFEQ